MSFNLSTFISCVINDNTDSSSLRTHHTCSSVFTFSYEKKSKNTSNSQNRQSRQRQRLPILKRSTFQGFRQYPGNQDLILCPILGIIFLTQNSDHFQDLIPDLDLEISTNQLNVIIVTTWVTLQTTVSDVRTGIFHTDSKIKVGEIISEILKDTQTTEQIPDTEMITCYSA